MNYLELRKTFLDYFKEKGHKVVPSSSLIPKDETVLLTSAGMQQFIPYFEGEKNPVDSFGSRHLVSIQKCFRTLDIEEVGDDTHNTFFEMLGNWSIGEDEERGYFKEEAIEFALDFFVNRIGLEKEKLWITIFNGEGEIERDEESYKIWQEKGIPKERIVEFGSKDNFWGPVAKTGPCGPCSEIHYDRGEEYGCKDSKCGVNCDNCRRFVELWNLVFMEYYKLEDSSFAKLSQRNIDTGIGFERLISILQKKESVYETDLFSSLIGLIENLSGKKYEEFKKPFRIISDHIRGAVFLVNDGVTPNNIDRGYILRRILRRAIRYGRILDLQNDYLKILSEKIIEIYKEGYPELVKKERKILLIIKEEEEKFEKTLKKGLLKFEDLLKKKEKNDKIIFGEEAFDLYQSYGFPIELIEELAIEKGFNIDREKFFSLQDEHKKISRSGVEKKFGGVGKDAGYESAKLHTAIHLLQASLREILGEEVQQMGSDVNSERLRFDFSYSKKISDEELKKVEELVNQKIKEDLDVKKEEMPYEEAVKSGALCFFKEKYPEVVNVYSVINSSGSIFSKEVCAGPHVEKTGELGDFKILKEKSVGTGIRRIKAILKSKVMSNV